MKDWGAFELGPSMSKGKKDHCEANTLQYLRPHTCFDREVLCLCLTQSFEMYSVVVA